jgi:hypothetical protein
MHDHIHHQQVHTAARLAQHVQGFGRGLCFQDAIALLAQNAVGDSTGQTLVINDQDRRGNAGKWKRQLNLPAQADR